MSADWRASRNTQCELLHELINKKNHHEGQKSLLAYVLRHLGDPALKICERGRVCHVEDEYGALSIRIELVPHVVVADVAGHVEEVDLHLLPAVLHAWE